MHHTPVSDEAEHSPVTGDPGPTRTETDSLGSVEVPAAAYWGVHTKRALENFPISKRPISVYPDLVIALAEVKQAAARAARGVQDPTFWNLGIAATVLRDWATARDSWSGYGIDLPAGDG
jgi:hypothetical protein